MKSFLGLKKYYSMKMRIVNRVYQTMCSLLGQSVCVFLKECSEILVDDRFG